MATVLSIDKSLDLLEAVAASRGGIGTRELSRQLGINVTTVHNIARTLAARGYLRQDPSTRKFSPGMRLFLLASAANLKPELGTIAMPFVRRAAEITAETAMLATFEQGRLVCLAQVMSRQALAVREQDALGDNAHCTAVGKMLLSTLSPGALQGLFKQVPLMRHTDSTFSDAQGLMKELELTRRRGYASVTDEWYEGVSAVAVLVNDPWGAPMASLGVSAPTQRFGDGEKASVVGALNELSRQISAAWADADLAPNGRGSEETVNETRNQ